jgi:EF-P beta-lysylation protein EpmB
MLDRTRDNDETMAPPVSGSGESTASSLPGDAGFPLLVPASFEKKIGASTEPEALLRQVMPHPDEYLEVEGFTRDPFEESPAGNDGLIEKYDGRLLLMVTQACAGHCRFCFRRHLLDAPASQDRILAAFDRRMTRRGDISEVILSGGDPLVLSDRRLRDWLERIASYPQVRRVRIHTRSPVFTPERITPTLAALLGEAALPIVMAVHVNHADELDGATAEGLSRLRDAGVILLTQTVLLRGVNDSADVLARLFERALDCGLVPYYLHQLDRVAGAAHFEVPRRAGRAIVHELRRRLPGYLVPRYVEEITGEPGKRPIEGRSV